MIIFSVDMPKSIERDSKRSVCYFRREISNHASLSVDIENVVRVLHSLFATVPHEISITFKF